MFNKGSLVRGADSKPKDMFGYVAPEVSMRRNPLLCLIWARVEPDADAKRRRSQTRGAESAPWAKLRVNL